MGSRSRARKRYAKNATIIDRVAVPTPRVQAARNLRRRHPPGAGATRWPRRQATGIGGSRHVVCH